jgi:capsular exopolysaccharide synthesis family protein
MSLEVPPQLNSPQLTPPVDPKLAMPGPSDGEMQALGRLLEVLSVRRWWFIVTAVLVFSGAVVVTRHQKPVYRATGMLHIESAPPKVLSEMNEVVQLGTGGYLAGRQYYQAQQQILQSRDLAAIVVNHLGLATDEHFLGIKDAKEPLSQAQKQRIIATADPVGMLAARVHVEIGDESMIAKVSVEDTEPEFAQRLVNGVMQAYKDRNIDKKRGQVREAFKDLQVMRGKLEDKRNKSRDDLFRFEQAHDFSDNRRAAVNDRILALNRDLRETHAQRVRAQAEMNQLKKFRNSHDIFSNSAPGVMRDGLVGELKRRYLELEIRKRDLEATYLEHHPKVEALTKQMDQLVTLASKHVNAMYESAVQTTNAAASYEQDLETQLAKARAEDAEIREAKLQHDQLLAKAEEDRGFYEKVAKRLAETDITRDVGVNNVSVLDMATVPRSPVAPNVKLNLLVGLLLALLCGLGAALSAEAMDNTVKDRFEIEGRLGVPFLGSIPTFPNQKAEDGAPIPAGLEDLYVHFRPNSRAAEAARSVRTNLLFMRPGKPLRSLLITSGGPREGKSSTSTTIGITIASSSNRTVLVDTDMRKPRLHKIFGVASDVGLTSYILTQEPITHFTRPTDVPGLDLLPCGPLPPNPAELLHTERFREMVRELLANYDTVLFDSPPVDVVSDGLVLASLVDGVVLVAQANRTRIDEMEHTLTLLRGVNAPLMGVVTSRAAEPGTGYGYYYGKGYRRRAEYRYRYAIDPEQERKEEAERRRRRGAT